MKFTALAALGCVSASSHQVDMFNPLNFMTFQHGQGFVQQMISQVSNTKISISDLKDGEITFSQCDSQGDSFILDTDRTSADPNPIQKGTSVSLDLHGIVSDALDTKNVHVHVDWNGSTLYDQDYANDKHYDDDVAISL